MKNSTIITRLLLVCASISIASCKQDGHSAGHRGSANNQKPAAQSLIARLTADPSDSSKAKVELVASDAKIAKDSSASAVEEAFKNGRPLALKQEGLALTASDPSTNSTFSLVQCPPGYTSTQPANQGIGINNIFSAFSGAGGGGSGLFGGLISGLGGSSGGGIMSSILGSFSNLAGLFGGGGLQGIGLPFGQTADANQQCVPTYGYPTYGQPTYGQPTYGQPTYGQPTYSYPTPYNYNGQYNQGGTNYYSYGAQSIPNPTTQPSTQATNQATAQPTSLTSMQK